MLLKVILMRAWAAAAFVEPYAPVSVFGVAVIIGMVICACLVATKLRHVHKGSRIAFAKTKATPRVDLAETHRLSRSSRLMGNSFTSLVPARCLLIHSLFVHSLVRRWWCGGPLLMTSCTVFRSARVFLFTPSTSRLMGSA